MNGIEALLDLMARLRDPDAGCPWDVEQSFASIAPYTIEEAYEVAEAIAQDDFDQLRDELGDLLFQVIFHARMAEEAGHFDFAAVVAGIVAKMVRRHPHVFGDARVDSVSEQSAAWEAHKADERRARAGGDSPSMLDGVAQALPALTRAAKLQRRAARAGFDWPEIEPVIAKVEEELDEVRAEIGEGAALERVADEIGDLLFSCVNLARHAGVDPEAALRLANARFSTRFRAVETAFAEAGREMREAPLAALDAAWDEAKRRGG